MTQVIEVDTPELTYTAAVTRKVSRGEYSNQDATEVTLYVQAHVPADTEPGSDEGQTAMRSVINAAKIRVLDSLGLEYAVSDTGEVVEGAGGSAAEAMVRAVFGQATQTNAKPAKAAAKKAAPKAAPKATEATEDEAAATPPFNDPVERSDEEFANRDWAKERFEVEPDDFFDNRESKTNPKAPDIRHKDFRRGGEADWKNSDVVAWLD